MAALNGLMGTVTMPDELKETDIQILVDACMMTQDRTRGVQITLSNALRHSLPPRRTSTEELNSMSKLS
jgi:hypothetical protein